MRHSLSLLCILPLLILAFFAAPSWAEDVPAPPVPTAPLAPSSPTAPLAPLSEVLVARDEELEELKKKIELVIHERDEARAAINTLTIECQEVRAHVAELTNRLAEAKQETASTFACAQADRETIETLRAAVRAGKEVSTTKVW